MSPDDYTNHEFYIDVGDGHQLYVHDWGNPKAKQPIVFLHGGPGSACKDKHKLQFDPAQHRVVFFDQRGAGRSLPIGSLQNNTTDDLIKDIVLIIDHFKFKKVVFRGGSWGCALALAFAVKHPVRVAAMVLDGIFTASHSEINYFDKGDFRTHFPDVWQRYLDATPKKFHDAPTKYHFKQAIGGNESAARKSACAYENLECALLRLDERFTPIDYRDPAYDASGVRLEIHYLSSDCFLPNRYILDNAAKLNMPVWLVHGRYDMVCPPTTAYELHNKLPNSKLVWTLSGHIPERETFSVLKSILLQFS